MQAFHTVYGLTCCPGASCGCCPPEGASTRPWGIGASSPFLQFTRSCQGIQAWGWSPILPFLPPDTSPRSHQHNRGSTDWAEPRSTYICKNCSQMFYTEKGLNSHMCFHSDQWPSPRGKQDPQVKGREAAFSSPELGRGGGLAGGWEPGQCSSGGALAPNLFPLKGCLFSVCRCLAWSFASPQDRC